ncbi:MAG: hypothetical protein AAFZ18_26575 [Myxococcota bacterium]
MTVLFVSAAPGARPVVEARHPAVRTWIHRIAASAVEIRDATGPGLSASQIAFVPVDAPRVVFDLRAGSSTTATCLGTSHPAISCAARELETLARSLGDALPPMRRQFREGAQRYRQALLWLRSRILSELGNNDLTGLRLAAIGPDLQPLLADLGLAALRSYTDVDAVLADHGGGESAEALFYPEDLPLQQRSQLRDAGGLAFPYRRLAPSAGLEDYDRATGFNLKQVLEAVRMVGEARRASPSRRAER